MDRSDKTVCAHYLGFVSYAEAFDLQLKLQEARRLEKIPDTLLFLEHPRVYTLGKRAQKSDFLSSPEDLRRQGFEIFESSRGGQITYHGPGQLVVYFIFNLYDAHREIKWFVETMEHSLCSYLEKSWNIQAHLEPEHPGIWVGNEKIAALGIAINNKITLHGFALNVNPRLEDFNHIIPCGIRDRGQTSLYMLSGKSPGLKDMAQELLPELAKAYGFGAFTWSEAFPQIL